MQAWCLDGLDTLKTRRIVVQACNELKIPFVHGAIAGFSGQLMTIFPGDKGLDAICGSSPNECGIETHNRQSRGDCRGSWPHGKYRKR